MHRAHSGLCNYRLPGNEYDTRRIVIDMKGQSILLSCVSSACRQEYLCVAIGLSRASRRPVKAGGEVRSRQRVTLEHSATTCQDDPHSVCTACSLSVFLINKARAAIRQEEKGIIPDGGLCITGHMPPCSCSMTVTPLCPRAPLARHHPRPIPASPPSNSRPPTAARASPTALDWASRTSTHGGR